MAMPRTGPGPTEGVPAVVDQERGGAAWVQGGWGDVCWQAGRREDVSLGCTPDRRERRKKVQLPHAPEGPCRGSGAALRAGHLTLSMWPEGSGTRWVRWLTTAGERAETRSMP